MRSKRQFAIVCGIVASVMSPAWATMFPAIGDRGDAQTTDQCPAGQFWVGLRGRTGEWVDQVQLICEPLLSGSGLGAKSYGHAYGGQGGSPTEIYCDPSSVVNGMSPWINPGGQVAFVQMRCKNASTGEIKGFAFFGPQPQFNKNGLSGQDCPDGEAAVGYSVNYGKHVNGLGLICGPLQIGAAGPVTNGFKVGGAIGDKWKALGGPTSALGAPTTDELGTPDGVGRFNHFQNGSIYWTPKTGAHEVRGAIVGKWAAMGWEKSSLGYPTTDESGTPDGVGRYNHFQNGSIYWTPQLGAFEVEGVIHAKWAESGWEKGPLGYPTSDEFQDGAFRRSNFQHGYIRWSPSTGAVITVQH